MTPRSSPSPWKQPSFAGSLNKRLFKVLKRPELVFACFAKQNSQKVNFGHRMYDGDRNRFQLSRAGPCFEYLYYLLGPPSEAGGNFEYASFQWPMELEKKLRQ